MKVRIAVLILIVLALAAGGALYPGAKVTVYVPDGRGSFTIADSPQPLYYKLLSPVEQAEHLYASLAESRKGIVPKGVVLGRVGLEESGSVMVLDFEAFPALEPEQERVFLNAVTRSMYAVFPQVGRIEFRIQGLSCQTLGGNYSTQSNRGQPVGPRGKVVQLWYSDGQQLVPVEKWLAQDSGSQAVIEKVIAALRQPPAGLSSILPVSSQIAGIKLDQTAAVLDFDHLADLTSAEAYLLLDGLTRTLFGSLPELQAIELKVLGELVSEIGGFSSTRHALERSPWFDSALENDTFVLVQSTIQHQESAPQPFNPEQPITIADDVVLRFVFSRPFDSALFEACWGDLAQEVSPLKRTQQGWEIGVQLAADRLQYGQDTVITLNVSDLWGNTINQDLLLSRTAAPEIVEFLCLTYPERKPASEALDPESVLYLPPGRVEFAVQFNKPVQRASVEKAMLMQRSTQVVLAWESDRTLKLGLLLNEGETYYVSFKGVLDADSIPVTDDRYYRLVCSRPSTLFTTEVYSREQEALAACPITVQGAVASPSYSYVLFKDLVSRGQPPRYDIYLWKRELQTSERLIAGAESIIEPVWAPSETLFVYGSSLYDLSGNTQLGLGQVVGAAFSPDSSELLVILKEQSETRAKIYDLKTNTLRVASTLESCSSICQPLTVYWLQNGSVLVGCPERNTVVKLSSVDLSAMELGFRGSRFSVAPQQDLLAYWQGKALYLYELQTGRSRRLPLDSVDHVFWSPDGMRLVLQHESGRLFFYDFQLDYLRELVQAGTPVGWIEEGRLLLYR